MQKFKTFVIEAEAVNAAKAKLKKMKKGSTVSFTHHSSGEKISGEYQGLKNMGGRSYAHVQTGKGAHRVPVHHIHQANVKEGIEDDHAETIHDFDHHIAKVRDKKVKAGFKKQFRKHSDHFSKAHNNDHDEDMDNAHGNMQGVVRDIKKHTGSTSTAHQEETVNELSKKTLGSYVDKASDDRAQNALEIGKSGKMNFKGLKRRQGMKTAVKKLMK